MMPPALALLVLEGLLDSGIASHGDLSFGWQVALAFKMVGAPSCGVFCAGQACFVAPSLGGQSGLCAAGSPRIGKARSSSRSVCGPCSTASCACEPAVEPSGGVMSCACPPLLSVGSPRSGGTGLRLRLAFSGGASSTRTRSPTPTYCPRPSSSLPRSPTPRALRLRLFQSHQWVRRRQRPWQGGSAFVANNAPWFVRLNSRGFGGLSSPNQSSSASA
jgi:hypothetical protein